MQIRARLAVSLQLLRRTDRIIRSILISFSILNSRLTLVALQAVDSKISFPVIVLSDLNKLTIFQSFSFQSKCSMFRGVILCLCLNITYANVVRFPRELNQHGIAFLFPYLLLLLFVGVPIVLLEIALGQFLGQGSAHAWRASPILRGKFLIKIELVYCIDVSIFSSFLANFLFHSPANCRNVLIVIIYFDLMGIQVLA